MANFILLARDAHTAFDTDAIAAELIRVALDLAAGVLHTLLLEADFVSGASQVVAVVLNTYAALTNHAGRTLYIPTRIDTLTFFANASWALNTCAWIVFALTLCRVTDATFPTSHGLAFVFHALSFHAGFALVARHRFAWVWVAYTVFALFAGLALHAHTRQDALTGSTKRSLGAAYACAWIFFTGAFETYKAGGAAKVVAVFGNTLSSQASLAGVARFVLTCIDALALHAEQV